MASLFTYEPSISYEKSFSSSSKHEAQTARIATHNGAEARVRVFTGDGGVEELLCTIRDFRAATESSGNSGSSSNNVLGLSALWKQCISHSLVPKQKWQEVTDEANATEVAENISINFDQRLAMLVRKYAPDPKAKETMINCLNNDKTFTKPPRVGVADHWERIETVMDYIDMLHGERGNPTREERKKLLFGSFPKEWTDEFESGFEIRLRQNRDYLNTVDDEQIRRFMIGKQIEADEETRRKKKDREKEAAARIRLLR